VTIRGCEKTAVVANSNPLKAAMSGRVAQDYSDTALGAELRVVVDQPDLAAT
jgi:hypothetical protein